MVEATVYLVRPVRFYQPSGCIILESDPNLELGGGGEFKFDELSVKHCNQILKDPLPGENHLDI